MPELTDVQRTAIIGWDANDLSGLMTFIKPIWQYSDCGYWEQNGNEYYLHTAGWSDNEEIVFTMQQNHVWWMMHWFQSQRGGHYIFKKIRD